MEAVYPSPNAAADLSIIPEANEQPSSSVSRFKSDFTVNAVIGQGGFGKIYLCTSRWDGMQYAVGESMGGDDQIKEIVLEKEDMENRKFLREVRMLALMKNKYIVRYNSV